MSATFLSKPFCQAKQHRYLHRFTRFLLLLGIVMVVGFGIGANSVRNLGPRNRDHIPSLREGVDPQQLNHAIHAAANYLTRATGDDGKLTYRVNPQSAIRGRSRYNVLRHAGAMYCLADYYERYPNADTLSTLLRQANFFQREFIGPSGISPDILAVWSKPELTGARGPVVAKLGGTGLGLVALLSVEAIRDGTTDLATLQALGRFIVFMQKPDGGFYSKLIPDRGGRSDEWTSLYYPGEAVLGLVMLYEVDNSSVWLEAAAKGIAYLARSRQGRDLVEADHWALLATERLLPHCDQFRSVISNSILIRHAAQICDSILAQRAHHSAHSRRHGCFTSDGRTCPTATRMEGLQAARTFLLEDRSPPKFEDEIASGIAFLMRSQTQEGPYRGAVPRAIGQLERNAENKDFNRRASEVRIDYVQHALSAWLEYERVHSGAATE